MQRRALLLEPFNEMREVLVTLLRGERFTVDLANDWTEVAVDDRGSYDVIVADVPFDESVRSVERRMVARAPSIAPHLVLMTTESDMATPFDADSRAAEVLHKPFDRSHFLTAVRRAAAG
jgi:DNA-binding NtrC family response regulator